MSETTLVFNEESQIADREGLRLLVRSMLPEEPPQDIEQFVASLIGNAHVLQSPTRVAQTLRAGFAKIAAIDGVQDSRQQHRLEQLARHERVTAQNREAYLGGKKFNQDAVWCPNPTRFPHPRSVFETLPFAQVHKIVDRSTPVTSAGSCFATEISHHLQSKGFGYVITEAHHFGNAPYSMASAAWGTIFNVPAMRQLVEKAFGLRQLPRLLWRLEEHGRTVFRDPFREEVEFASVAEYEANYEPHVDACRRALLEAEVFVITLGLTEVWRLKSDGSVLSRVPWRLSSSLVERCELSVEENLAELELLLQTLRRFQPRMQFIVSVSPVPLQATFRGQESHVVAASSLSKCTLRVAAEQFAERNEGVFYFPAFETVMYCTEQPFERDHRHVRRATVARVMRLFHTMFVRDRGFAACAHLPAMQANAGEVRFLLHPDWKGDFGPARDAIECYRREFQEEQPVQLLLWLPQDCGVATETAQSMVVQALEALGLDPAQGPAMTILAHDGTLEVDMVLDLGVIVLSTGGQAERSTCRRARQRDLVCADPRQGEMRAYYDSARELFLVGQALEQGLQNGSLPAHASRQVELLQYGWRHLLLTGSTPTESYHALRNLHVASGGRLGRLLEEPLRQSHPPRWIYPTSASVLGALDGPRLKAIRADLERDGYYVFPQTLSAQVCDALCKFARRQPVWGRSRDQVLHFDDLAHGSGQSATFDFEEAVSLRSPEVQRLCIDPGFLAVAQAYLECEPVLDLIALWWSLPFDSKGSSASGQLYHFDLDRPNFLKFFVYLTDVGLDNGPHHFVRGSHREPRRETLCDRRLTDEEVASAYDLSRDEVIFSAPRGTIFAEDTRGLHKGAALRTGERLVFQLEFSSTLFGAPFRTHDDQPHFTPELREAINRRRHVLQRFAPA